MRVVGSHRSALGRQVSEAIRIRRREGLGSILNSKSEYNRCHITRLRVEDKQEAEERDQRTALEQDKLEEELTMGASRVGKEQDQGQGFRKKTKSHKDGEQ